MNEHGMPPGRTASRDAIDVSDFVYAATGARVRRLTMPDGSHWFPAVDVAAELGYTNTRDAIAKRVPSECVTTFEELARTLAGGDAARRITGRGLRKSMRMLNLHGVIHLVAACTKPEAEPFRCWVTEVVATVQKAGAYTLEKAEVQPAAAGAPAYAMPREIADAIVRLEERTLHLGDELAASRREALALREEALRMQGTIAHLLGRIAESLERVTPRRPFPERPGREIAPPTAEDLLAGWKARHLVVTGDTWAVAVHLAHQLAEHGECRHSPQAIAAHTGLTVGRVRDCLRMMLKRGCIRRTDTAPGGAPCYVLP